MVVKSQKRMMPEERPVIVIWISPAGGESCGGHGKAVGDQPGRALRAGLIPVRQQPRAAATGRGGGLRKADRHCLARGGGESLRRRRSPGGRAARRIVRSIWCSQLP